MLGITMPRPAARRAILMPTSRGLPRCPQVAAANGLATSLLETGIAFHSAAAYEVMKAVSFVGLNFLRKLNNRAVVWRMKS